MKRDMDLVRDILLRVEEAPFTGEWVDLDLPGRSDEEVSYHVMLLGEAGLIEAMDLSHMGGMFWMPKWLTWAGHEFLEASRDSTRWEKAKAILRDKGGSLVFAILKELLVKLASNAVFGAPPAGT